MDKERHFYFLISTGGKSSPPRDSSAVAGSANFLRELLDEEQIPKTSCRCLNPRGMEL